MNQPNLLGQGRQIYDARAAPHGDDDDDDDDDDDTRRAARSSCVLIDASQHRTRRFFGRYTYFNEVPTGWLKTAAVCV